MLVGPAFPISNGMKNKKTKQKKDNKFVEFFPINKQAEPAIYYGFNPIEAPIISKEDVQKASSLKDSYTRNCPGMPWFFSQDFIEERIAILREYSEKEMSGMSQPVMLVNESDIIKERSKTTINLEIIGSGKSIAEALLIKTAISILEENGYKDFILEINSIGDKESMNKFSKELTAYYRKNINSLSSHCRQNFKKDSFYVLHCDECDKEGKIKEGAPTSISALSDESRIHFKDVLEFIETMGIPYKINNCLVPDKRYCSGTIFEIKDSNTKEVLAVGFRYDGLAQKIGHKRDVPGVGIKIFLNKKKIIKKISKLEKPKVFYIQLGDEAKNKSLGVIEMLRKEQIYLYHMLGRDKLGSQFAFVEKMKIPYVIIMGKKEFLEDSVMVRENSTRTQESVKITELARYIRRLK